MFANRRQVEPNAAFSASRCSQVMAHEAGKDPERDAKRVVARHSWDEVVHVRDCVCERTELCNAAAARMLSNNSAERVNAW